MKYLLLIAVLAADISFAADLPSCDEARKSEAAKSAALSKIRTENLKWTKEYQQANSEIDWIASQNGRDGSISLRLLIERQRQIMREALQLQELENCIQK